LLQIEKLVFVKEKKKKNSFFIPEPESHQQEPPAVVVAAAAADVAEGKTYSRLKRRQRQRRMWRQRVK